LDVSRLAFGGLCNTTILCASGVPLAADVAFCMSIC